MVAYKLTAVELIFKDMISFMYSGITWYILLGETCRIMWFSEENLVMCGSYVISVCIIYVLNLHNMDCNWRQYVKAFKHYTDWFCVINVIFWCAYHYKC
jgi:hypothetical protein